MPLDDEFSLQARNATKRGPDLCVTACAHFDFCYANNMTEKKNKSVRQTAETWTVRGIEPETKTAAHMAARRAGLPVGKWLNRAIRDAATEDIKAVPPPASPLEDTLAALVKQMQADREDRQRERDELTARLSAIEARTEPKDGQGHQGVHSPLARLYGLLRGK